MKSKFVSLVAIVATSIYPTVATAATIGTATVEDPTPVGPNSTTLAAMATQCNALAVARDLADPVAKNIWTAEVVEGDGSLINGPTEAGSARVKSNIQHAGDFIPGVTYIQGDPFRIGGSVNMFGDQYATSGSWTDSTYDFTNNFNSTFSYAFNCELNREDYNPPVYHPAVPLQGYYINCDSGNGQGNDNSGACTVENPGQPQGACEAYNGSGSSLPFWGQDKEQCKFIKTADAQEEYWEPESWEDAVLMETVAGTPINQVQTDNLSGHESHGGPVQAAGGPFHIGQVVICISPSTTTKKGVPGAWRQQNGYTGNKCDTNWFQSTGIYAGAGAVWGAGTESSNGTYISVPDYTY